MARLSPVTERLRDACVESIDRLLNTGKAQTIKAAARIVWSRARQRHQETGFALTDFDRFYWTLLVWYRKSKNRRDDRSNLTE